MKKFLLLIFKSYIVVSFCLVVLSGCDGVGAGHEVDGDGAEGENGSNYRPRSGSGSSGSSGSSGGKSRLERLKSEVLTLAASCSEEMRKDYETAIERQLKNEELSIAYKEKSMENMKADIRCE